MRLNIALAILFIFTGLSSQAQYQKLSEEKGISVQYKWKQDDDGKTFMLLKIKNKTGKAQMLEMEIGFFIDGFLEETVEIKTCMKKTGIGQIFQKKQAVSSENIQFKDGKAINLELKLNEMEINETQDCNGVDQ